MQARLNGGAQKKTEGEIRVRVRESSAAERAGRAAVCMLRLVTCQKCSASDRNAIKLKAIVSASLFRLNPF